MSMVKTQIWLTQEQGETLKKEALWQHISISGLIRQIVDERIQHLGANVSRRKMPSFIGIGASGLTDVSENVDKYVGEAIAKDHHVR